MQLQKKKIKTLGGVKSLNQNLISIPTQQKALKIEILLLPVWKGGVVYRSRMAKRSILMECSDALLRRKGPLGNMPGGNPNRS